MPSPIPTLLTNKDYKGLKKALSENPALANEGIPLDDQNPTKAHPLHRICNGVFIKAYSDEEAVKMAKIFLEYGADVNGGNLPEQKDTPLIAAASLHADKVAVLLLEKGANIHHAGTHGGTALHWACWCGRDKVVDKLIQAGADIKKKCIDFTSTPLYRAVHGYHQGGNQNLANYLECVNLLPQTGANKNAPNFDGQTVVDILKKDDLELRNLLNN